MNSPDRGPSKDFSSDLRSELPKLTRKLERASAGSRVLDAHLVVLFNWRPAWCVEVPGDLWVDVKDKHLDPAVRIHSLPGRRSSGETPIGLYPEFTTSIDAALALIERVLPGTRLEMWRRPTGEWGVNILDEDTAYATTLPLALCIALLKALSGRLAEDASPDAASGMPSNPLPDLLEKKT